MTPECLIWTSMGSLGNSCHLRKLSCQRTPGMHKRHGHFTVVQAISAARQCYPSMVIFSGCLPRGSYENDTPLSWIFLSTESRHINNELFLEWLRDVFLTLIGQRRPVPMLLENMAIHWTQSWRDKGKGWKPPFLSVSCLTPSTYPGIFSRLFYTITMNTISGFSGSTSFVDTGIPPSMLGQWKPLYLTMITRSRRTPPTLWSTLMLKFTWNVVVWP